MQIKKAMTMSITVLAMTLTLGANAGIKRTAESTTVEAHDIDLRTVAGQDVLYSRLQGAAREVCGDQTVLRPGSLRQASDNRTCYREALTRAVESVGHDGLSEMHNNS